ncbi:beta-N-acetylhexosaminidase [Occallatibacter riparius]|uniref:Family 20 glycosylhydrolase n=1 Tax=Occallatibacter riparius TaxID=1002689 RepID=A0A9J7BT15_9BACT|nr:family 20 glycosylhydrolase [Occallatibacter riparius]UWZ85792.1 family 20 glycosylhydrolase [Occallatibacter riparius]
MNSKKKSLLIRPSFVAPTIASLALLAFAAAANAQPPAPSAQPLRLMPLPSSVQTGQGSLSLNAHFHAGFTGNHDPRLDAALDRFLARLDYRCGGIRRMQHDAAAGASNLLTLQVAGPGAAIQNLDEDESYKLSVTPQGATLTAANDLGAMHGLETFLQLVNMENGGCQVPAVTIDDTPRFRWRGMLVDVVRHFEPVDEVERTLDAMAIAKLNVFHWHLSDDEGFRAESKKFPKLTETASGGLFYTQDEMREVVAYARARGIRVIPEFDMPGHSTSEVLAYPEYGSGEDIKTVHLSYEDPRAELDPSNEKTYKFIDTFVGEMGEIFPDDYYHVGGDETEGKAWLANPRIKAFMDKKGFKTTAELQTYFNQRLLPILAKHHKKMVGWDEILTPGLPKDIMIQSWRGLESLSAAAVQGYTGMLSTPYYLDHQDTAEQMFLADVVPSDTKLTPDQQKLILGGEICMWAEQINPSTIDSRIWPRSLAIAERFWSPQSDRDVPDMYRRMRAVSLELEEVGIRHIIGPKTLRRSLAGSTDPEALDTFASVLEPVSFGDREDTQHTDAFQSLNRLVDSVVADPPARQQIARDVNTLLSTPHSPEAALAAMRLRHRFESWQEASPSLQALCQRSSRLNDAADRAHQLGQLARAGLESLAYLENHTAPPAGWADQQTSLLADVQKPSALVKYVFLPDLEKLVKAAATR